MNSDEELQIILADYSNDLHNLKRRDDLLPAQAAIKRIGSLVQNEVRKAEIRGMEKAKSRVLRRTEIPADAKNPTRDIVVVVGEECARIISDDIAALKEVKK